MNEHRSRFKAYLIAPSELNTEAARLRPYLEEFHSLYMQEKISAAEWATLFVFLYLNERTASRGHWWMKKVNRWGENLPDDFFLAHWLRQYQFKKLPESVARSLYFWMKGKYAICFKQKLITPYEMLEHQARGERVVTLAQDSAVKGELVDGSRDALEFLLHDLVHADLFFSSPDNFLEQKSFFASILKVVDGNLLSAEQKNDPQFEQDFNYLISDMNSHPAHLAAMLKASYIKHLLFCEGKAPNEPLSGESQKMLRGRLVEWQKTGRFEFPLASV